MPLLVDLQPAGRFLMEDFHRAGGLLAVLREVARPARPDRAHRHRAAAGRLPRRRADLGPARSSAPRAEPLVADGGIAVLRGNLAPDGARRSSRPPPRRTCCGTAAGPSSSTRIEDFHARIDDPDLDVDADSVLVLRGCGPKGYPGMPEVANMPLPKKLLEQGVRDMVRICDGRMSGTAYGTVVLHVAPGGRRRRPARAWCGPATRSSSTSPARRLDVDVPDDELAARVRRTAATSPASPAPGAAGNGSTSTTSCRPTPAPTWTSSSAPAARR